MRTTARTPSTSDSRARAKNKPKADYFARSKWRTVAERTTLPENPQVRALLVHPKTFDNLCRTQSESIAAMTGAITGISANSARRHGRLVARVHPSKPTSSTPDRALLHLPH